MEMFWTIFGDAFAAGVVALALVVTRGVFRH